MKKLMILTLAAAICLTNCDKNDGIVPNSTLTIATSADIPTGDWPDRGVVVDYIVKIPIAFGSGVINIAKNVTIQFEGANAGFTINGSAAVKMIGTADAPIILSGTTAAKGSWKGIVLNSSSPENIWEHMTLRDAGSTIEGALVMVNISNQKPSIKNCTITNNKGYGVYSKTSTVLFTNFSNNTIADNSNAPMYLQLATIPSLDSNNILSNNTNKFIEINTLSFDLNESAIWNRQDVPYRLSDLVVKKRLELRPGTSIEFLGNGLFAIGSKTTEVSAAVLIANGTAAQPISITGLVPNTKNQWEGIKFNSASVEHVMNHCKIDGAGSENGSCATFRSAISIGRPTSCTPIASRGQFTNLSITNSGGYGIAYRLSDSPTVSAISYANNSLSNVFNF